MTSYDKGHTFETTVLNILYKTNPFKISHYDGGSDRGRDIVVTYEIEDVLYEVIIQCKYYNRGVKIGDISSSLDWAKIHRPTLLYFWVYPYLTVDTKDYLSAYSKEYGIFVDYEEGENIEQYKEELFNETSSVLIELERRIKYDILKNKPFSNQIFSPDECYLVDREDVRKELIDDSYRAFFVQGISCSGKTQLLKHIAFYHYSHSRKIFWFTFHESNSETQIKSFWHSLSVFFSAEYHNQKLIDYFNTYGYHMTNILEKLAFQLLESHNEIIIIDDMHKCSADNDELKDFFEEIVRKKVCIIFFAGWFNLFEIKPEIEKQIKNIALDGLDWNYLNKIIIHNTGVSNPAIAKKIVAEYNGLPGFAAIVDTQTQIEDFESDKTFIYSLLDYLNEEEKNILFTLVYASTPLTNRMFLDNKSKVAFESLLKRKLILRQKQGFVVHDKYKGVLKSFPLSESQQTTICSNLLFDLDNNEHAAVDAVILYIFFKNYEKAIVILNHYFKRLLHSQPATELLKVYQTLEEILPVKYDKQNLMLNKAIILERCEEYDLCLVYIEVLKNRMCNHLYENEERFYLELRCLYFTNSYDKLLDLILLNSDLFGLCSASIKIQISLLIGRVFYIRGQFEQALYFYILSYKQSLKNNDKVLLVKTIHRITMVEMKMGYVKDALASFQKLQCMDSLLTIKRKSYILYRIADCEYQLGMYKESLNHNIISKDLKESISNMRGQVFFHRLNSKIALATKNYPKAVVEIELATNLSKDLELHKEEVACAILKAKIMHKMGKQISIDDLRNYLDIAFDEGNIYRIKQLFNVAPELASDENKIVVTNLKNLQAKKYLAYQELLDVWWDESCDTIYNKLISNKSTTSMDLLKQSGLISPL